MGTSNLMTLGTRAMFASYASLQTTGQNIANAGVDGYSRQSVDLKTAKGQFTGAGFFGKGVDVDTVTRSHDEFLTREAAATLAAAAGDEVRATMLARLEEVFPTGEAGIGHAAGQFLNAMVDLASRPQDSSTREVVLSRAGEVAARFSLAGQQLDSLQAGVTADLKNDVATINGLSQSIADVNQQIAMLRGLGHAPNDLLDQRDQLIKKISNFLQVSTIPADDGTIGVFIAGGQRLVLSNQPTMLQVVPDPDDNSRSALGIVEASGVRVMPSNLLTTGSVPGLLRFQNHDLQDGRNLIGRLAVAFIDRVNEQQSLGLDLRTPAGAGAPLFDVGGPVAQPASTNLRDAGGSFMSSITLTVVDASQLHASDYALQAVPGNPGTYALRRLSDGWQTTVIDGDVVDGFQIDIGVPEPAVTDRFLLQPVNRAANGVRLALDDPRAVAAASPLTATQGSANTGTASIDSLRVVSSAVDPTLETGITFTSATGDYDWVLREAATGSIVSSGSGVWSAGDPIGLNGFELMLNGVPANGDTFSVVPTQFPAASNGNALALAALRDETMVGRLVNGSGATYGGETITDAYASAMAGVGVRVQAARTSSEISASVAQQAEAKRASKSGVNLDEEAAQLIQFQQSYQAAAKVLQVAQSVFDTLLQTTAG